MSRPDRVALKRDFDAVRQVLCDIWNPIGIGGLPEDEYDSYVWPLVRMLREGADAPALEAHLDEVEQFYFSMSRGAGDRAPAVQALLQLSFGDAEP